MVDRRLGLSLLLHDAPEYVIGDMISPLKAVIGGAYKNTEKRLLSAIHRRFGLPPELPDDVVRIVKAADRAAALLEVTRLAGFSIEEGRRLFGSPPELPPRVECELLAPWLADTAKRRYLDRFAKLAAA